MQKEHGSSPIMILDSLISRAEGKTLWERPDCLTEESLRGVLRKVRPDRKKTLGDEMILGIASIAAFSDELF